MIRAASAHEEATVRGSLEAVQRGLYDAFLSGKMLGVVEDSAGDGSPTDVPARRVVVLVDAAVLGLPAALREGGTGGLPIGVLDDGFALDLQGAIVMARETRRQTVRVNEKASRLFLYGRNIIGTSILHYDPSLRPGDHCIVTNPRHEALGIGRVVGSFKAPRTAVEAVHDLGSYLRDE